MEEFAKLGEVNKCFGFSFCDGGGVVVVDDFAVVMT